MAEDLRLNVIVNDRQLKELQRHLGGSLGRGAAAATAALTGVATATIGVGVAAGKMNAEYTQSLQQIVGLAGQSQKQVDKWGKQLLKLGPKLGKGPKELADALYFVASSGVAASKAMSVVTAAAKASTAGLGDTQIVADAVTSAMNSYRKSGLTAAQATDTLIATVREGKGEAADFATVIGDVAPIAASLGVSFNDVGAALAGMTQLGTPAEKAATNLQYVFQNLLKVTPKAEKAFASVGLNADDLRKTLKDKGLMAVLQEMQDHFKGNTQAMVKAFPSIQAVRSVLSLTGDNAANVAKVFERMKDNTGDLDKAFAAATKGGMFRWRKLSSSVKALLITIGGAIQPLAAKLAEFGIKGVGAIQSVVDRMQKVKGLKAKVEVALDVGKDVMADLRKKLFGGLTPTGAEHGQQFIKTEGLVNQIADAFGKVNWTTVATKIATSLAAALGPALQGAVGIAKALTGAFAGVDWGAVGTKAGPGFVTMLLSAFNAVLDVGFWIKNWKLLLAVAINAALLIFTGGTGKIAEIVGVGLTRALSGSVAKVGVLFTKLFGKTIGDAIVKGLGFAITIAGKSFKLLVDFVGAQFARLGKISQFVVRVLGIDAAISAVVDFAKKVIGWLKQAWNWIASHWKLLAAILIAPFSAPLAVILAFRDKVSGAFGWMADQIVAAWNKIKTPIDWIIGKLEWLVKHATIKVGIHFDLPGKGVFDKLGDIAGKARHIATHPWTLVGGGGDQMPIGTGGKLNLPAHFSSTHQTAGLSGFPAIDVFGPPGTIVGAPASGTVERLSGRPWSAGWSSGPGSAIGLSVYLATKAGEYFLTHFDRLFVGAGARISAGTPLGTIGPMTGAPPHIHEGLKAFAKGGYVTKPTLALIGERGPELVVPVSAGGLNPALRGKLPGNVSSLGTDDIIKAILFFAAKYGVDPRAVLAVAKTEGGLRRGAKGDKGTSFGPFQMHLGGTLPAGMNPSKAAAFANSIQGIAAAIRMMAEAGAKGKMGFAAIEAIVNKFERPADKSGEIKKAAGYYKDLPKTLSVTAAKLKQQVYPAQLLTRTQLGVSRLDDLPIANITKANATLRELTKNLDAAFASGKTGQITRAKTALTNFAKSIPGMAALGNQLKALTKTIGVDISAALRLPKNTVMDVRNQWGEVVKSFNPAQIVAKLRALRTEINKGVLTGQALAAAKAQVAQLTTILTDGFSQAQQKIADLRGSIIDRALSTFDAQTTKILGAIDTNLQAQLDSIDKNLASSLQAIDDTLASQEAGIDAELARHLKAVEKWRAQLTPAEALIKNLTEARDKAQAARTLTGAQQTLGGAQARLALLQQRGASPEALKAQAQVVADAQQSLDDVLLDQRLTALQKTADKERAARDKQAADRAASYEQQAADQKAALEAQAAAQKAALEAQAAADRQAAQDKADRDKLNAEAERAEQRKNFETDLTALLTSYADHKISAAKFNTEMVALFKKYGVDYASAGDLLGVAFGNAFAQEVARYFQWVLDEAARTRDSAAGIAAGGSGGTVGRVPGGKIRPQDTGSCFPGSTKVRLIGGDVPFHKVKIGDDVVCWDMEWRQTVPAKVIDVLVHSDADRLLLVETDRGWVTTTPEHRFWTGIAWVAAGELQPHDRLATAIGSALVEAVTELPCNERVFNLEVDHPDHNYFAGGFLVHNMKEGLQHGGIVTRPIHALIGEAGAEAVIPLDRAGGLGDTYILNLKVEGAIGDPDEIGRKLAKPVRDELLKVGRRNSGLWN